MGYQHYILADGRHAGYGVADICNKTGCTTEIDRGLGFLCGRTPGGDEYGCGGYFCGAHLTIGQQCEDCRRDYPLCVECGEPVGGRDATYPEGLGQECYDKLSQHDRYSLVESLLLRSNASVVTGEDSRLLVQEALRGVRRSWEIDCKVVVHEPMALRKELP